jgi:hypothetical protein
MGALVGVAETGALVGARSGALVGLAGSDFVGDAGVGALGADGATGAAPLMGGATGAEGAVGVAWYLAQQRGRGRPRSIKRRQYFLPRRVLQKSAEEGAMQASSIVNAKRRVDCILCWW